MSKCEKDINPTELDRKTESGRPKNTFPEDQITDHWTE